MFFVYVLRSVTTGKLYTGITSDIQRRLSQHNAGVNLATRNRGPFKVIYVEQFPTRSDAARREMFLKTGRGREALSAILSVR